MFPSRNLNVDFTLYPVHKVIQKVAMVNCFLGYVTKVWHDYRNMFCPKYALFFYLFCQPCQNQIVLMISELQGNSLYFLLIS